MNIASDHRQELERLLKRPQSVVGKLANFLQNSTERVLPLPSIPYPPFKLHQFLFLQTHAKQKTKTQTWHVKLIPDQKTREHTVLFCLAYIVCQENWRPLTICKENHNKLHRNRYTKISLIQIMVTYIFLNWLGLLERHGGAAGQLQLFHC